MKCMIVQLHSSVYVKRNLEQTILKGIHFSGVANVFLECLFHDVIFEYNTPIISQQGEVAGRLQVSQVTSKVTRHQTRILSRKKLFLFQPSLIKNDLNRHTVRTP